MKRRGFLGLLGTAAVAGPAAAKNAVTQVVPLTGGAGMVGALTAQGLPASLGYGAVPSNGLFSKFDRMMKLKALISGEEHEEPEPYEMANVQRVMAEHRISALHSISPAQKVAMYRREAIRIERERKKAYWLQELFGLEKESP